MGQQWIGHEDISGPIKEAIKNLEQRIIELEHINSMRKLATKNIDWLPKIYIFKNSMLYND